MQAQVIQDVGWGVMPTPCFVHGGTFYRLFAFPLTFHALLGAIFIFGCPQSITALVFSYKRNDSTNRHAVYEIAGFFIANTVHCV